jgi:hypothetical protein
MLFSTVVGDVMFKQRDIATIGRRSGGLETGGFATSVKIPRNFSNERALDSLLTATSDTFRAGAESGVKNIGSAEISENGLSVVLTPDKMAKVRFYRIISVFSHRRIPCVVRLLGRFKYLGCYTFGSGAVHLLR